MALDQTAPVSGGSKLGKFELIKEVAGSGVGSTWIARSSEDRGDRSSPKLYAILRLHRHVAKNLDVADAFLKEARRAQKLKHPNVIQVHDTGVADGEVFVVSEYVEGESLASLLRTAGADGLPLQAHLRITLDTLEALSAAHALEPALIHGELGPWNIFLGVDGVARVSAFGTGRALAKLGSHGIKSHDRLAYAAPERVKAMATHAPAELDPRCDLFSVAVMLWEGITRQRLFTSKIEAAVIQKVLTAPIAALSSMPELDVPPDVDEAVQKALERDPARRFATAHDLILSLEGAGPDKIASSNDIAALVSQLGGKAIAARKADIASAIRNPSAAPPGKGPSAPRARSSTLLGVPVPAPLPSSPPAEAAGVTAPPPVPTVSSGTRLTSPPPFGASRDASSVGVPLPANAPAAPPVPRTAEADAKRPSRQPPPMKVRKQADTLMGMPVIAVTDTPGSDGSDAKAKATNGAVKPAPIVEQPAAQRGSAASLHDEDMVEVDMEEPSGWTVPPAADETNGDSEAMELAKAEPAKAEPAKAEPAKAEPAKAEPAKAEPAKPEAMKTAAAKPEAQRTAPTAPAAPPASEVLRGGKSKPPPPPAQRLASLGALRAEPRRPLVRKPIAPAAGGASPKPSAVAPKAPGAAATAGPANKAAPPLGDEKPTKVEPKTDGAPPPSSRSITGGASTTPSGLTRGPAGAAVDKLRAGSTLGRYEILMQIARGGMASVWAARIQGTRGFQKMVAVKTMLPDVSDDPDFETMFLDEARVAARIRHPNVVEILDLGEENDVLYLVMEWVEGETVGTLQKAAKALGGIPIRIVLRIASQVCAGLHAAHELRDDNGALVDLVHRDVSPANILLSASGFVKIVDFGIAKSKGRLHVTRAGGMVKGKTPYLSPEQLGSLAIDRRSDIFSLGALLYVLTTGLHPFRGETELKTIENIALKDPVPMRDIIPGLNAEFEKIVFKALEKEPGKRYATAGEMQRAIDQLASTMGQPTTDEDVATFVRKALGDSIAKRAAELKAAIAAVDEGEREPESKQEKAAEPAAAAPLGAVAATQPGETEIYDEISLDPDEPSVRAVKAAKAAPPRPPPAPGAAPTKTAAAPASPFAGLTAIAAPAAGAAATEPAALAKTAAESAPADGLAGPDAVSPPIAVDAGPPTTDDAAAAATTAAAVAAAASPTDAFAADAAIAGSASASADAFALPGAGGENGSTAALAGPIATDDIDDAIADQGMSPRRRKMTQWVVGGAVATVGLIGAIAFLGSGDKPSTSSKATTAETAAATVVQPPVVEATTAPPTPAPAEPTTTAAPVPTPEPAATPEPTATAAPVPTPEPVAVTPPPIQPARPTFTPPTGGTRPTRPTTPAGGTTSKKQPPTKPTSKTKYKPPGI